MLEAGVILIVLGLIAGFYMAWSIGANDVANAMGTSVGSGALTLTGAVIVAGIMEFAGAFLVGARVTDTMRKGIVPPEVFAGQPELLVYGMLAALLAAAVWLQLASYFGWPVSTTHSIVGAIIGFAAVVGGPAAIDWSVVSGIVGSWIITPFIAAALAYILFTLILRFIFYSSDPVRAARRATPVLVFAVFFVMTLVTVFKGLANLNLDLEAAQAVPIATGVGLFAAVTSWMFVRWRSRKRPLDSTIPGNAQYRQRLLEKAARHLRRVQLASTDEQSTRELGHLVRQVKQLERTARTETDTRANPELHETYRRVERVFVFLQIISAAFVAFAHGSNDVANAIGPLAAIIDTVQTGAVHMEAEVHPGVLALGGLGIVIGLATWGWRVIQTIGQRITELTPSRGFAAEFAAATTIVIASRYSMPISTTQTLVGAVLGVGFARGISALNLNTVRDIFASWIITIPAGAGLAILFFYTLQLIFG
ncbi:MAG: inorganic phosphate transporter [Phycisphaeraceae bacterium]